MPDKAILHIGSWSSRCGVCGRGAFPEEKAHLKEAGYRKNRGDGCGVVWTHVACNYVGEAAEEATKSLRPDLIYIGCEGA